MQVERRIYFSVDQVGLTLTADLRAPLEHLGEKCTQAQDTVKLIATVVKLQPVF